MRALGPVHDGLLVEAIPAHPTQNLELVLLLRQHAGWDLLDARAVEETRVLLTWARKA